MRYFPMLKFLTFIAGILLTLSAGGQRGADTSIQKTKGYWIDPIERIVSIDTSKDCGHCMERNYSIKITSDSPSIVRSVLPGKVAMVTEVGDFYAVITIYKNSFLYYSGLQSVLVKKGDSITIGQPMGHLQNTNDNRYEIEMGLTINGKIDKHIQDWFSEDFRKRAKPIK